MCARRVHWQGAVEEDFVRAVDAGGGVERAQPKQVLELMQVGGAWPALTKDQIKSHLQQTRLRLGIWRTGDAPHGSTQNHLGSHTRKRSASSAMEDADAERHTSVHSMVTTAEVQPAPPSPWLLEQSGSGMVGHHAVDAPTVLIALDTALTALAVAEEQLAAHKEREARLVQAAAAAQEQVGALVRQAQAHAQGSAQLQRQLEASRAGLQGLVTLLKPQPESPRQQHVTQQPLATSEVQQIEVQQLPNPPPPPLTSSPRGAAPRLQRHKRLAAAEPSTAAGTSSQSELVLGLGTSIPRPRKAQAGDPCPRSSNTQSPCDLFASSQSPETRVPEQHKAAATAPPKATPERMLGSVPTAVESQQPERTPASLLEVLANSALERLPATGGDAAQQQQPESPLEAGGAPGPARFASDGEASGLLLQGGQIPVAAAHGFHTQAMQALASLLLPNAAISGASERSSTLRAASQAAQQQGEDVSAPLQLAPSLHDASVLGRSLLEMVDAISRLNG